MPLNELRGRIGQAIEKYLIDYREFIPRSRRDEKLFRDPIFGFQRVKPHEVLLIDSPLFQRLRGLSQTALAYLTYPASIHTRFEHSINCLNLAQRIIDALINRGIAINPVDIAEVRIAALLHDIGHCIFSHASEFFYRDFAELEEALDDDRVKNGYQSESELINYCIITSCQFKEYLWDPIVETCQADCDYLRTINLERIAQIIIGISPNDDPDRRFLGEIINGPIDIDKLDYITRDAYFTGINLNIDIERLLPSLRVTDVPNPERARSEKRLVVDHRGIAVVEQLLFARMVLYDSVYHHHKVRAATSLLQEIFKTYSHEPYWPTRSGMLESVSDFLEMDQYDFFGNRYPNRSLQKDILSLKSRMLPERALVIAPRTLTNVQSHTTWSNIYSNYSNREDLPGRQNSEAYFSTIKAKIRTYAQQAGAMDIMDQDIIIDVPDPPGYSRIGRETLIQIVSNYVEPLANLFPFQKVVNNYSNQYKYRTYIFSKQKWREHVAYGAFRAFSENGIQLNDLSLILAHQDVGLTRELLNTYGIAIPDWRTDFYIPDIPEHDA